MGIKCIKQKLNTLFRYMLLWRSPLTQLVTGIDIPDVAVDWFQLMASQLDMRPSIAGTNEQMNCEVQ